MTAEYLLRASRSSWHSDESPNNSPLWRPNAVVPNGHGYASDIPIAFRSDKQNEIKTQLGEIIGEGFYGVVYAGKSDPAFVIKKSNRNDTADKEEFYDEAQRFARYYDENALEMIDTPETMHLKMFKVPAKPMSVIQSYPQGAADDFHRMMMKMENAGLRHADIHAGNFMYKDLHDLPKDWHEKICRLQPRARIFSVKLA